MNDTAPWARRYMVEAYRKMPAWKKIEKVRKLNRLTTGLAMFDIRRKHPDASEHELRLRLGARRYGAEVMRRYFDWDVRVQGY